MKIHKFKPLPKDHDFSEYLNRIPPNEGKFVRDTIDRHKSGKVVISECIYCKIWHIVKPGNTGLLRTLKKEEAKCMHSPVRQWLGLFGKWNCLAK